MCSEPAEPRSKNSQLEDQTSETLLRRVRDWSDERSWRQFFDTYAGLIYSVARKAGLPPAEADDIVQTTMIGIAERIRNFRYQRDKGSFRGWVCMQAKSKIRDHLRRRRREGEIFRPQRPTETEPYTAIVERFPDYRNDPLVLLDRDSREELVEIALTRVRAMVKPKHYQIFDLAMIKQWPLQRISRTLGVNPSQVYLIKSRIALVLKRETRRVQAQLEQLPASKTSR